MRGRYFLISVLVVVAAACGDGAGPEGEGEVFVANLTGDAERPPVITTSTGTARVTLVGDQLTFLVTVEGIANVTNAHIHAPADTTANAPIALNLNPQFPQITSGTLAQGSAQITGTTVSMDSLRSYIRRGLAYVNVHTSDNPPGHIRGQLFPER